MTTTLRVYLRPGWPDLDATMAWAALDGRGAVSSRGDCAPGGWPKTDRLELVLPAGRTVFNELVLPAGVRQLKESALGYALEEGLCNDPMHNLFACNDEAGPAGKRVVAVTEATPVRLAVVTLKKLGRLADRILPEEALLPPAKPGNVVVALRAGLWMVRLPDSMVCQVPDADPDVTRALLQRVVPDSLLEVAACGQEVATRWQSMFPSMAVSVRPDHDWQVGRVPEGAVDFARGELAANRRWRTWRPALLQTAQILGVLLASFLLIQSGKAVWWGWQTARLSTQVHEIASRLAGKEAGQSAAVLNSLRVVDRLRLAHGEPARESLTGLMGEFAAVATEMPQVHALSYENGRLSLRTSRVAPAVMSVWREQLEARRVRLSSRSLGSDEVELTLTLES